MSDRIAVFNDGEIQQISAPDVLYELPENSFVAQFVGENNRFVGEVKSADGDLCRVEIPGHSAVDALRVNAAPGGKTMLSLRPERVFLGVPAEDAVTRAEGKVRERIYMGDHIRVRLSLFGTDEFIVKVPNQLLHGDGGEILKEGDTTPLWWRPQDCRALDFSEN